MCGLTSVPEQQKHRKQKSGQNLRIVNIPITEVVELSIIIIMNVVVASSGASFNKVKSHSVCIGFS